MQNNLLEEGKRAQAFEEEAGGLKRWKEAAEARRVEDELKIDDLQNQLRRIERDSAFAESAMLKDVDNLTADNQRLNVTLDESRKEIKQKEDLWRKEKGQLQVAALGL